MKNPDWKVTDLLLRVILTKAGDWIADLIKESLVIRTDTTEWLDQKKKNKVHLVIWVKKNYYCNQWETVGIPKFRKL